MKLEDLSGKKLSYYKKQRYMENILYELLSLLPSSYNKENQDTNYYKLFRSFAKELSDAKIEMKQVEGNAFLEYSSGNSTYNNFGVLVNLRKETRWSDDEYKNLVSGVIKSLLIGPTKESIEGAFKSFFDFNVNIYELFKDNPENIPNNNYPSKYTFMVELEVPIDSISQTEQIDKDALYLINIVKPAHTFGFYVKVYVGEENYREYYSIDKKIHAIAKRCLDLKVSHQINKKIDARFENEFTNSYPNKTADERNDFSEEVRNITNDQYLSYIYDGYYDEEEDEYSPSARYKYLQYLLSVEESDILIYPVPKKIMEQAGYRLYEYTKLEQYFHNNFPTFSSIVDELANEYIGATGVSFDDAKEFFNEKLESFLVDATFHSMTIYEKNIYQQLREEAFLDQYGDETQYNEEDIDNLITIKENLYLVSREEAEDLLKIESLRDAILFELGGMSEVYSSCLTDAEKYRDIFEKKYYQDGPYIGMDKYEIDYENNIVEGIYGWRHYGYPIQFILSDNKNFSRIGGTTLVGPIYTLHDEETFDIEMNFEEQSEFLFSYKPIILNDVYYGVGEKHSVLTTKKEFPDTVDTYTDDVLNTDIEFDKKDSEYLDGL